MVSESMPFGRIYIGDWLNFTFSEVLDYFLKIWSIGSAYNISKSSGYNGALDWIL
jgi:hypothetical protein